MNVFFFHKVFYKQIVFNHSNLMVCFRIVKDARCKIRTWDTLMSKKRSVQADVLSSL